MTSLDALLQDAASLSLAPPGASVSFASPVAASAAATGMEGVTDSGGGTNEGDTEGTGDSKRCYPVAFVLGDDSSVCFGVVKGDSFCIRKNCSFRSHATNKVGPIGDRMFFISRVKGATVYAQPSVHQSMVPFETQEEWSGKQWLCQMPTKRLPVRT
jgi:hypothetical protein